MEVIRQDGGSSQNMSKSDFSALKMDLKLICDNKILNKAHHRKVNLNTPAK